MHSLIIIAETNCPWNLDSELSHRFQQKIYIPLPDIDTRKALCMYLVSKKPHVLQDIDYNTIANKCEGRSCGDISEIVHLALMEPVKCCGFQWCEEHFSHIKNNTKSKHTNTHTHTHSHTQTYIGQ